MSRLILLSVVVTLFVLPSSSRGQAPASLDANALVQKIQAELGSANPPEASVDPAVPHGEILNGTLDDSKIYPGTQNDFQVYVPAQYDPAKPACLMIKMDGLGGYEATVLDNLIAKKDVPVIIAVGISPGAVFSGPRGAEGVTVLRYNRCYQFDSMNDRFPNFILDEILPAVQKMKTQNGRAINISSNGNDHMTFGASSGAICAFNLAWRRPDQFQRVYSTIGTFVPMRGGHEYFALIRKTEPKPIRIFTEDGDVDAWNLNLGSWYDANLNVESALTFSGYDVAHAWGKHGHDGSVGARVLPDVMRWLWRDYPAPIKAGSSQNDKLGEILVTDENWKTIETSKTQLLELAANPKGEAYVTSAFGTARTPRDDSSSAPASITADFDQGAFGADGTFYGIGAPDKKVISVTPDGQQHVITERIAGSGIAVTHDNRIYVSEPGEHSDMPSKIWLITPDGKKKIIDEGLHAVSGIALSPDGKLFFAAEKTSKWIYSYVVQPDGTLTDKQPFFWLHMDDITGESGTTVLAIDQHGNLYAATRMGIQVCDQNGRVRAILPLPTPCGPAEGMCFGGPQFDELYVTDGLQIFKRKMKVPGVPPWSPPVAYPSQGAG